MKEPYSEGVATHAGPESCGVAGNGGSEALTGECAGWVLSPEVCGTLPGADAVLASGRPHHARRYREASMDPAGSETSCMHGSSLHGTREIPRLTSSNERDEARTKNPKGAIS